MARMMKRISWWIFRVGLWLRWRERRQMLKSIQESEKTIGPIFLFHRRGSLLIAACLFSILSGCSLRVFAAATTAALDVYSTALIESSTPEDRAEIRATLASIKPYTDQAAASVNAKLALIDSIDGELE